MSRLTLVPFLLAVAAVSEAGAADVPEAVAATATRYEADVAKLQAEHTNAVKEQRKSLTEATATAKKTFEAAVADAAGLYGKELDRLAAKAKDAGDLDTVLTLKTEREKLSDAGLTGKAGKLPAEAGKARTVCEIATSKAKLAFDAAVAKARKDFEAAERGLVQRFTAAAREAHAAHLRELLDVEKSETKDGKIDSAVAIRTFRTQIEKSGPPLPEGDGSAGLSFRSGAAKTKLLKQYGGNTDSELAVARGLAYLARQQKANGSWAFDGSAKDSVAATGLCTMAFLAAGQSHKTSPKYAKTVDAALKYLVANQKADGSFVGTGATMYTHGIASIAVCEAYALTQDRTYLRSAQAAINFIVAKQAADGSWGYAPGTAGDTSILGWQLQALRAARFSKDIVVPQKCIDNAMKFLTRVSSGRNQAVFGYTAANGAPGTSLTAIGLLGRNVFGKWGSDHPGLVQGAEGMLRVDSPQANRMPNVYRAFYATQLVRTAGGDDWLKWNEGPERDGKREGGMRDCLVGLQEKRDGANAGSWPSDNGIIGGSCGRIGCTALALLTLEVYYRYQPVSDASAQ